MQYRTILGICRVALLAVLATGLAFALPDTTEAANLNEIKKLTGSNSGTGDQFGESVAISDDTAIVGAFFEDHPGIPSLGDAGAAYVYKRDQGGASNWGQVKRLIASDAQTNDIFGWRVAISGDIAVVGAQWEDAGGSTAGAVYVFGRNMGGADNWGEAKKVTASDAQAGDLFGGSVSISGDTIVVGAVFEDAGGANSGAVYLFQRNEGGADNWGEVKKLTASDAQANDFFGASVAVSGDTAVVGARLEDAGGDFAGAAYVFQRDEGGPANWGKVPEACPLRRPGRRRVRQQHRDQRGQRRRGRTT
ncbi:MAG: FG-GAP repeat protein [Chloroflexi bacterium]|nr:FG-GAP repeat protein [Chloroflexota bacterium]